MTAADPGAVPDPRSTARGIALLRLAFVPVAVVQTLDADVDARAFPAVLTVFAAYAIATLGVTLARGRREPLPLAAALADLVLIAALVYTSGGARSPLCFAFFAMPIAAALRLTPRLTVAWAALAVGAYLAVALPHSGTHLPGDLDVVAGEALALAWVGAAAAMLSGLVERRERNLQGLAAAGRRLVREALDAEARERRRLAQALHDDAIQNVLVARQEVSDVARGVPQSAERARHALDEVHRQLREEMFAMHPVGLERAGLAAVLRSFAEDAGRRGRFDARVDVDPAAAGMHDELLMSTARELLANAARHAGATRVDVSVRVGEGRVRLTVADDGGGFPAARLEQALAAGHIGLASIAERIRAVGGQVAIDSRLGGGTVVDASVPTRG
ncbi:sensor histidine kinase [Candidatus Solirubrobacter pratensis]|uniref:sensor histidine kinase n=1 Tax=Candidatus Solirubrobacter pratensis TaxID=1298857 RepID=UPI00040E5240|nr:ATP-binding protein [Candidatus Solirubrobacter pratensis]